MIYIFFTASSSWLSRLIRWASRGRTSHTGLIVDIEGIPMALEALQTGYQLSPYSRLRASGEIVATYPVAVDQKHLRRLYLKLGTAYDFGGLFGSAFVQVGRLLKKRWRNPWNSQKALFCSEAIAEWLREIKYPGAQNLVPAETSPQDLLEFFGG